MNKELEPGSEYNKYDTDGDGVGDNAAVFPNDGTETIDTDSAGIGNNADADDIAINSA